MSDATKSAAAAIAYKVQLYAEGELGYPLPGKMFSPLRQHITWPDLYIQFIGPGDIFVMTASVIVAVRNDGINSFNCSHEDWLNGLHEWSSHAV